MNQFKSWRTKGNLAALLMVTQLSSAAQSTSLPLSAYFPKTNANTSIVVAMGARSGTALVGPITPSAVQEVKRLIRQNNTQVLYIDSGGGDVASAIDLSNLLRDLRIRLVVSGRCLSACANFIFPAAHIKDVLPGSLLGIHGNQFHYFGKGGTTTVSQGDGKSLQEISGDITVSSKILKILKSEREFYKSYKIDNILHRDFDEYLERRSAVLRSTGTSKACPTVDFWVLRHEEIQKMGIKGLRTVWTPKNITEAKDAALRLGLDPHTIFFGSRSELSGLCRKNNKIFSFLRSLVR